MIVLVAGAHGTTGQHLTRRLAEQGHTVRAMIRAPEQFDAMAALGAQPIVADLTDDLAHAVRGTDAVVFAAGSKGKALEAVDRDGAKRLIDAAEAAGVERFVMLSSISADKPDEGPEDLRPYLHAKHAADEHLRASGLTYTIFQPGALDDEDGTGRVQAADHLGHRDGTISRADVAAALAASLQTENTHGRTIELLGGDTPVEEALRKV